VTGARRDDGAPADLAEAWADRLADDTLALVRIRSEIGDEGPLCDRVQARLAAVPALRVWRHGNSLLADLPPPGGASRPVVLLLGHLDTVPTFRDTPPRREGGRVYGCGASDMKGSLAVMLALARTLSSARGALPYHVAWAFYEREEGPLRDNGLSPLLDTFLGELPPVTFGVALEPTDLRIHLGCVGSLHASITFRGRKAHAARPWQGENAITKAGRVLALLEGRPPTDVRIGGLLYREVMTVTAAEGGAGRNVVPDRFLLNVNVRFAPGRTAAEAEAELRGLVGADGEVEVTDAAPAGPVCVSNSIFKHFQSAVGAEIEAKQAWTDVAQLGARGIDAVNYGPGATSQAHQVGEHVDAAALAVAFQSLWGFLAGAGAGLPGLPAPPVAGEPEER